MGATGSHLEHISSEALTACMSTDAGQRASSSLLRASFLTCKMEMKSDTAYLQRGFGGSSGNW